LRQLLKNSLFVIVKSQPLKFCLNSCAFSHPCYTICSYELEKNFWKKYKIIYFFVNQLKNKIYLFLSGKLFPLPPSPPYQNLKVKKKSFHSNIEKSELAMQRSKQSKFIVVAFLVIHFLSFCYSEKMDCSITMFRKRAICKAVQN
jgi:hypothetical protein